MHISFALLADGANLSQEGKLNILGVFDAVQVGSLPTVHPRAHLVLRLKGSRADIGTHVVAMRWINPQGEEVIASSGELSVGNPPPGIAELDIPLIATLDLPLDRQGTYTLAISLDNEPKAQVTLEVRAGASQIPTLHGLMS